MDGVIVTRHSYGRPGDAYLFNTMPEAVDWAAKACWFNAGFTEVEYDPIECEREFHAP